MNGWKLLKNRQDIIGFYLASMISEDESLLSEFGSLFSEQMLLGRDSLGHTRGWDWGGAIIGK